MEKYKVEMYHVEVIMQEPLLHPTVRQYTYPATAPARLPINHNRFLFTHFFKLNFFFIDGGFFHSGNATNTVAASEVKYSLD